jgi:hypothetical protein
MTTATSKRFKTTGAISRAQAQAVDYERIRQRDVLAEEFLRYHESFDRLKRHYGRNLPPATAPEAAATALFVYGRKAQILDERDRPAFVRSWG